MLRVAAVAVAAGFFAVKAPNLCFPHAHCSDGAHEKVHKKLEQIKQKSDKCLAKRDQEHAQYMASCKRNSAILKAELTQINYGECLLIHKKMETDDFQAIPQIERDAELARQQSRKDFESRMNRETGDLGDYLASCVDDTMRSVFSNPGKMVEQIFKIITTAQNPTPATIYSTVNDLIHHHAKDPDQIEKLNDAAKVLIMQGYDPKGCEKFKAEFISKAKAAAEAKGKAAAKAKNGNN
jgi:hypothetical protein